MDSPKPKLHVCLSSMQLMSPLPLAVVTFVIQMQHQKMEWKHCISASACLAFTVSEYQSFVCRSPWFPGAQTELLSEWLSGSFISRRAVFWLLWCLIWRPRWPFEGRWQTEIEKIMLQMLLSTHERQAATSQNNYLVIASVITVLGS